MTSTIAILIIVALIVVAVGAAVLVPIRTTAKTEPFVDSPPPGMLKGLIGGLLS